MAGCITLSSLCAGCWDGVKVRELPVRVLSGLPPLTGGHGHHGVKLHTGLAHRLQCIGDWYQIITKKGLDWHNVIMFILHTAANVKSISLPVPESRPSLWKLNNVVSVMCKVSAICHCPVHSHTVTLSLHLDTFISKLIKLDSASFGAEFLSKYQRLLICSVSLDLTTHNTTYFCLDSHSQTHKSSQLNSTFKVQIEHKLWTRPEFPIVTKDPSIFHWEPF